MKEILIVGANSKISKQFIKAYANKYKFCNTFKNENDFNALKDDNYHFVLDLNSIESIDGFLGNVKNKLFSWILLFSSIYREDDLDDADSMQQNLNVNVINLIYLIDKLIKNWNIEKNSKIIFFKDAWTRQPKNWYIIYSIAKNIIGDILPALSVKYNDFIFLWIDMGPVYTEKIGKEGEIFYNKSLIKVDNPSLGLINFLNYLLNEINFFSTWSVIDFSWWTYLIRKK